MSEGDDAGEIYAREVVEALGGHPAPARGFRGPGRPRGGRRARMKRLLRLREPLAHALGGFELVDAGDGRRGAAAR